MSTSDNTDRWYRVVIETLILIALFLPPTLALVDGLFATLCLPRICGKGGCLTLWGLLLMALIFAIIIRYAPIV